jgi:Uncharacterized protein containing caspase domain
MRRLACLIGNNNYAHWNPLNCAVNDAMSMESVLQEYGFDTTLHKNLIMNELKETILNFEFNLANYDAGLLFFAGHGVEIEGRQYLVPTDSPKDTLDFDRCLYDTTALIQCFSDCTVNEENFAGIIVFDCCRSRMIKSSVDRGYSADFPSQAKGVYIAFATEPGGSAKEVDKHGLFTLSLCNAINQHGSEKIEDVFKRVRKDVVNQCGEQIPWDHSSLLGDFYFKDAAALLKKNMDQGKDWLTSDFLRELLDTGLNYMQIKDRVYLQADEMNATVSQKEELLKKVLNELDDIYINRI